MATSFSLTSTNNTGWISTKVGDASVVDKFFVLLSGTGSCRLEYSLDGGITAASPDDMAMTGPGSYGFTIPREVTHVRVTNISGNSVGSICR